MPSSDVSHLIGPTHISSACTHTQPIKARWALHNVGPHIIFVSPDSGKGPALTSLCPLEETPEALPKPHCSCFESCCSISEIHPCCLGLGDQLCGLGLGWGQKYEGLAHSRLRDLPEPGCQRLPMALNGNGFLQTCSARDCSTCSGLRCARKPGTHGTMASE